MRPSYKNLNIIKRLQEQRLLTLLRLCMHAVCVYQVLPPFLLLQILPLAPSILSQLQVLFCRSTQHCHCAYQSVQGQLTRGWVDPVRINLGMNSLFLSSFKLLIDPQLGVGTHVKFPLLVLGYQLMLSLTSLVYVAVLLRFNGCGSLAVCRRHYNVAGILTLSLALTIFLLPL